MEEASDQTPQSPGWGVSVEEVCQVLRDKGTEGPAGEDEDLWK